MHNRTDDITAWLNAVITYQQTCLDGFEGENNSFKNKLMNVTVDATQLTGNALSIINGLPKIIESFGTIFNNLHQSINKNDRRHLLQMAGGINNNNNNNGYPSWFSHKDRKLLARNKWTPNAVVAKDGSGQYKSIQAAVDAYPNKFKGRYV